ncbi:amidase domain-containing protein [Nonomuraea phyllanthi]|uniref:amidase domain-containing protein n=1 Tax=Nonomuraea phyllanthi TaxID=2219224 RepID=UPI0029500707|nr:amidase domain-containing protein [Nonomuraea phyllanthi]
MLPFRTVSDPTWVRVRKGRGTSDGSVPVGATLRLGAPSCEGSSCTAAVEVRLSSVSGEVGPSTTGSDIQAAIEADPGPYGSIPSEGLQVDPISLLGWIVVSSTSEQPVEFGGSGFTEIRLRYRLPSAPGPVGELHAMGASNGAVLSWLPPTDPGSMAPVEEYDVQVTDSNSQVIQTHSIASTHAEIFDLAVEASYTIAVRAKSRFGEGPWSSASVTVPAAAANACDDPEIFSKAIKAYEDSRNDLREQTARTVEDITSTNKDAQTSKAILYTQQPSLVDVAEKLDKRGIRQTASSIGVVRVMLFHDQEGKFTTAQAEVTQTFEYIGDIGTATPATETNETRQLKSYTFLMAGCDGIQVRDSSEGGRLVSVTPDMNEVPTGPGSIPADGMDLPIDSDGFPELPIDDAFMGPSASNGTSAATSTVNRTAAVQWALRHYLDDPLFGNDCTNFVSRALHYGGGAAMDTNGTNPTEADRRDPSQWFQSRNNVTWYNSWAIRAATSWSWSGANSFFQHFMSRERRATWVTSWQNLRVGDILLWDFTGGNPDFGHVAIVSRVTSNSWKGVQYAQHSDPYNYRPMAVSLPAAKKAHPKMKVYAIRVLF